MILFYIEPPLPPKNISFGGVTASRFILTWSSPTLAGEFSITFYVVSFHPVNDKPSIKAIKSSASEDPNVVIDNLMSDTFYNVFVRAENKFGEGENSEKIQVKTSKEDGGNF